MRRKSFNYICLSCVVLPALVLSCSSEDVDEDDSTNNYSVGSISLGDLTSRVIVDSITIAGDGFLIASVGSEEIGVSFVTDGNSDIVINLERPLLDGEELVVGLHHDSNENGVYDSGVDLAVLDENNVTVDAHAQLEVSSDLPDLRFILDSNGSLSWIISSDQPAFTSWGDVSNGQNPTLTFFNTNYRIEFVNPITNLHPLSLLTKGATSLEDIELIVYGGAGTFIDDTSVNVVEEDNVTRFTLTDSLAAQLTGYRCNTHIGAMRGSIVIQ